MIRMNSINHPELRTTWGAIIRLAKCSFNFPPYVSCYHAKWHLRPDHRIWKCRKKNWALLEEGSWTSYASSLIRLSSRPLSARFVGEILWNVHWQVLVLQSTKMTYEAILARSFSRYEQRKLRYGALIGCLLIFLSFFTVFKPYLGPLPICKCLTLCAVVWLWEQAFYFFFTWRMPFICNAAFLFRCIFLKYLLCKMY